MAEEIKSKISEYTKRRAKEIFEGKFKKWKEEKIENWWNIHSVSSELKKRIRNEFEGMINLREKDYENLGIDLKNIRTEMLKEIIQNLPDKQRKTLLEICKEIGIDQDTFYRSGLRLHKLREFRFRVGPFTNSLISLLENEVYKASELFDILKERGFKKNYYNVGNMLHYLSKRGIIFSERINVPGRTFKLFSRDLEALRKRAREYDKLKVSGYILTPRQLIICQKIMEIGETTRGELEKELRDQKEFENCNLKRILKYNLKVLKDKVLIQGKREGKRYVYSPFDISKSEFEVFDKIARYYPNEVLGKAFREEDLEKLERMGWLSSGVVIDEKLYKITKEGMIIHKSLKNLIENPTLRSAIEGFSSSQTYKDIVRKQLDELFSLGILDKAQDIYIVSPKYRKLLASYLKEESSTQT